MVSATIAVGLLTGGVCITAVPSLRDQDSDNGRERLPRLAPRQGARRARRRAAAAAPRSRRAPSTWAISSSRSPSGDILDRDSVRNGARGRRSRLPRRRHDLAPLHRTATASSRSTSAAPGSSPRRRCGPGSSASSTPPRSPAIGPAKPGGTADESQLFTAGHLGIAYMNSKHEAEAEVLRAAAKGLPAVIVNPLVRARARRSHRHLERADQALPHAPDPGVSSTAGSTSSTCATSPTGHLLADERGMVGERYILGGQNFTLQRLFAELSRIADVPAPTVKAARPARRRRGRGARAGGDPGPGGRETRSRPAASGGPTATTKAERELGFEPRPHEETLADTIDWQYEQLGERAAPRARHRRGDARRRGRLGRGSRIAAADSVLEGELMERPASCSTAARRRRTSSAPAARSSASCAGASSSTGPSGWRCARRPPRDRRADRPAPRAGADRRRRGHPRFEADPAVARRAYYALQNVTPIDLLRI